MKISGIIWGGELPLLNQACEGQKIEHVFYTSTSVREEKRRREAIEDLKNSDLVLIHPSQDPVWDEIIPQIPADIPIVPFGYDQEGLTVATVSTRIVATASAYYVYGGAENLDSMIRFLRSAIFHESISYDPPEPTAWDGIYHPDADGIFTDSKEYFSWRERNHESLIGILFYRLYWANRDLQVINDLIRRLEQNHDVIAVFCIGTGDADLGARPGDEVIRDYCSHVDLLVNLQSVTISKNPLETVKTFSALNVPVIHPLIIYNRTHEEWLSESSGLTASEIGWAIVVPEFMGMTGMIPIGTRSTEEPSFGQTEWHESIPDRMESLSIFITRWVGLKRKKPQERKIAFILNNAPCSSIEATVGTAAHLDALESVACILSDLKDDGYDVEVPANGKELIDTILEKKALSEFRWTSVEEIVAKGGALDLIRPEIYLPWFAELPGSLKDKLAETWGKPPGEEKDGVPPGMVYHNSMVITGLRYGNALVCTQPKRGCVGARCDGQVCKILHDSEIPPPYHYFATYRYLTDIFGADVLVHVGTHGTLEFLPGKSAALSESCIPAAVLRSVPLLYLYNTDNPPEGTIAKRRTPATLIGHMQSLMSESGLYGELAELADRIDEYNRIALSDPAHAHALEHVIIDLITKNRLDSEINVDKIKEEGGGMAEVIEAAHESLTRIYNSQIPEGMHIFGQIPRGEKLSGYIVGLLRFNQELRKLIIDLMGLDLIPKSGEIALLKMLDEAGKKFVNALLSGLSPEDAAANALDVRLINPASPLLESVTKRIFDLSKAIEASDEKNALRRGLNAEYIMPGPSGLISRGKTDILPTGRNFYSLDPFSVPTEAAFRVGRKLAEVLLKKFSDEEGKYPETVAVYWMASDIMWSDGETLGKLLHLLGVEPVWRHGRVTGIRPLSLETLNRPRIDISIRASGILRDCFYNCIELLDDAVCAVATLSEPDDLNYVRKHQNARSKGSGSRPDSRIFGSRAGTYGMGVNLALYASAWKDESELADIYISWNGYSYGRDRYGESAHDNLIEQLKTVDVTFNKTATDEYDLLGCCCYFGTHGGMTIAAETVQGHKIATYYGDTRDPESVEVRTLAEELTRVVRTKLLNPKYIDGLKEHGYAGASELSRKIGRVYGWDATTGQVDDWIFDDIARTFLLNDENRKFFEENNPYAMEEIGRRLLEANQRGVWQADPDVLEGVKESYLMTEGLMEDRMDGTGGQVQG
ncbi:MAG TPA: cobaltochelatase subunit CobN, partial [Methanospirillum sp.]|uniref:cobaltochelatase subunit CobN n=1 Tax=Methanospirillum sp. TaxID=45200 RepID=UPI002BC7239B